MAIECSDRENINMLQVPWYILLHYGTLFCLIWSHTVNRNINELISHWVNFWCDIIDVNSIDPQYE